MRTNSFSASKVTSVRTSRDGTILDTVVSRALVVGLNELGQEHGLPTIEWLVWGLSTDPSIEGFPPADSKDPEGVCLAWAHALELDEFKFDTGEPGRSWFSGGGHWYIEVTMNRPSEVRVDPQNSPLAEASI
jgi:hypothetical protein